MSNPADPNHESDAVYRVTLRRAFAAEDLSNLELHFEVAVVERYVDAAGFNVVRTSTVGRIRKQGAWTLDFGIAPDETLVHATAGDLLRLPTAEREHWAAHAVALPSSKMFLQMRLSPASCFDDGDLRPWR